jgi:hypothetical protein
MIGSDDPSVIWREAVHGLFAHLCRYFEPDKTYGEFEVAQRLDVHRIIADEWLTAMVRLELIEPIPVKHRVDPFMQCLAFRIPKAQHVGKKIRVEIEYGDLREYDPWTDRQYDDQLVEAHWPERYCDKYFNAHHHEYYLITGRSRKRPDGTIFVPLPADRAGLPPLRTRKDPVKPEERQVYAKANSLDLSEY